MGKHYLLYLLLISCVWRANETSEKSFLNSQEGTVKVHIVQMDLYSVLRCLFVMTTIAHTWGSNVLMYPYAGGFSSRLMNIKKLAHILVEDGYTVTILLSSDLQNKNSDKLERNDDNIDTSYYTAPGAAHSLSYLNTSEKLLLDTPPKEVRSFLLNSQCSNMGSPVL